MMIRQPVPADAPVLGRVHAEAWQAAYPGLVPEDYLARMTAEARSAAWERRLTQERRPGEQIAVAVLAAPEASATPDASGTLGATLGQPVGFAHTGPCRDVGLEGCGELYSLNVAPDHWRVGAGGALVEHARDSLAEAGFSRAVLWVVTGNDRARRFYERHGWAFDGTVRDVAAGGGLISESRYAIDLARRAG